MFGGESKGSNVPTISLSVNKGPMVPQIGSGRKGQANVKLENNLDNFGQPQSPDSKRTQTLGLGWFF